ncbi:MAG: tRNA (adenosine(37)-N6)-threonylcarbamoyltransferase complex transferase subunit TsaD [bacterium]|nr:tRNA (adenosine(37)-N6)-threonylcarbamoyltransferase complex transferase subunit TsaD [bacterium]
MSYDPAAAVLGIETSCDETAAAVVAGGHRVRSSVVTSQIDLHRAFGGVVPEIASRAHLELLPAAVEQALTDAELEVPDAVAATAGPGLLGALVVGVSAAKALALAWDVPLAAVNHLEAHLYAAFLDGAGHIGGTAAGGRTNGPDAAARRAAAAAKDEAIPGGRADGANTPAAAPRPADPAPAPTEAAAPTSDPGPELPMIVLLVSGGHTMLIEMTGHGRYELLGQTLDDAAGEAYDKVARLLGLGYPGGPAIDRLATEGDPEAVRFPRPMLADGLDFSFSGLKTAVAVHLRRHPAADRAAQANAAASFQRAAVDVLATKTLRAAEARGISSLCLAGGVAANSELRARFEALGAQDYRVFIPTRAMCTDNAAMVAAAGWHQLQRQGPSPLEAAPKATWLIPQT